MVLLFSLACAPQDECAVGFELRDGLCYSVEKTSDTPPDPTTPPDPMELLREGWEPCDVTSGDGTLELDGCALGVCAGETYAAAVDALGEADELDATADPGYVNALWFEGVSTWYPDLDLDGVSDETGLATWITVFPNAITSTVDGLGPGVSMSCFVDQLGEPDEIELRFRFNDWEIVTIEWFDRNLKVWDYLNHRDDERSDGEADYLYLSY